VVHRSGAKHGNADGLSCRRDPETGDEEGAEQLRVNAIRTVNDESESPEASDSFAGENLAKAQQDDEEMGPIVKLRLHKAEQPPTEDLLATSESTKILWSQWDRLIVLTSVLR